MSLTMCVHFGSTTQAPKRIFRRLLEAEWEDCAEIVVDLKTGAELLWRNTLEGPALEAAMAEVDEQTKGQPYRIETSIGPLLARQALWRHAGRCGGHLSDDMTVFSTVPRKDRPSWDGDYRPLRAEESKRIKDAWRRRQKEHGPAQQLAA